MVYVTLFKLEFRKQRPAFISTLIFSSCLLIAGIAMARFFKAGPFLSFSTIVTMSAMISAVFLGTSGGHALVSDSHRAIEDELPADPVARALAAYCAGTAYLSVYVAGIFIVGIFTQAGLLAPGVGNELCEWQSLWIVLTVIKLQLLCFVAACWIRLALVSATIAILAAFVDASCCLIVFKAYRYFSQFPQVNEGSQYLLSGLILLDVLLLILALYTAGIIVSDLYGKKRLSVLRKFVLPVVCLVFGPFSSWLAYVWLLNPSMHAEYDRSNFLMAVLFEAAHNLGFI